MVIVSSLNPLFTVPTDDTVNLSGGNILTRWTHAFSETSSLELQVYYDRTERREIDFGEVRDTFDIDFQHHFALGRWHEIIWGLGHRILIDHTDGTFTASFDPENNEEHLLSAFIQDEITLIEDRLRLTVGSKFENNEHTGFEIQPSARILFTPSSRQTVWAAVSRAVKTPARAEDDIEINVQTFPGGSVTLSGDEGIRSEELLAWELGYRVRPTNRFLLDIATFYNDYENLVTREPQDPFLDPTPTPHMVFPLVFDNKMDGETYGAEVAANWNVTERWKLAASYTYLQIRLQADASSVDPEAEDIKGASPHNQFQIRSYVDLPYDLEFDAAAYYVDSLPSLDVSSYVRLDLRLGWYPTENLEVSLVMQNLLDKSHTEFFDPWYTGTEIERSIYGKITWRF